MKSNILFDFYGTHPREEYKERVIDLRDISKNTTNESFVKSIEKETQYSMANTERTLIKKNTSRSRKNWIATLPFLVRYLFSLLPIWHWMYYLSVSHSPSSGLSSSAKKISLVKTISKGNSTIQRTPKGLWPCMFFFNDRPNS